MEQLQVARPDAPLWSERAIRALLQTPQTHLARVVEQEGRVAGLVLATAVCDEGELLLLTVAPTHRRRRLGRTLIDDLVAQWMSRGVQRAFLEVHPDNLPARRLYEQTGWTYQGHRPRYYPDGREALLMRWGPTISG